MSDEAGQPAEAAAEQNTAAEAKHEPAATGQAETASAAEAPSAAEPEDTSYQAVEKEGVVTAIWEMQGQKHLRTIDPRSIEGKQILALFETAG